MLLKATFLALSLFCSVAYGKILVQRNGTFGFTVKLNDLPLFKHSIVEPMFQVGIGSFEAVYIQGNFNITDNITKTYPLDTWRLVENPDSLVIYLSNSTFEDFGISLTLTEAKLDVSVFKLSFDYFAYINPGINRFFLQLQTTKDEMLWGGGEQYSYFNLRGRNYPIWTREQGVGRNKSSMLTQAMDLEGDAGGDYHTTYWPQVSFLSSQRYHLEMSPSTYAELRFAPLNQDASGHTVYWHRTPVQGADCGVCNVINIRTGNSLMDLVKSVNPGAPPLPRWVHSGAIIGVQGGTDKMLGYLEQADKFEAAICGLWIQDWSGKIVTNFGSRVFWNWRWNETWYPNLDKTIQQLKARNVRVLAYINPHLNTQGDIYQSHANNDYWLKTKDGKTLVQDFGQFDVATVDVIKPEGSSVTNPGREFYKSLIRQNMLEFGFGGWMADFGEYTPMEARSKTGAAPWWGQVDQEEILHQVLPEHWASLTREVLEETGLLNDTVIWFRAGGPASKHYANLNWAGDQTVDWTQSDGLKSSIVAALSMAVSGMGVSHSDIGGYTSIPELNVVRSKELLLRWSEYAVFTPVMRTHESNRPQQNHQFYSDEDTWRQFARLTRLHADLADYIVEAVEGNALWKIPVMRPLFLQFENDAEALKQDYQYMFGDDLLIAPVTEPGFASWAVYLPEVEGSSGWQWLWGNSSSTPIQGPRYIIVPANLGEPPVFYKVGTKWNSLFEEINRKYRLANNSQPMNKQSLNLILLISAVVFLISCRFN